MLKTRKVLTSLACITLPMAAGLAMTGECAAQVAPVDIKASPEVYKEVAGNSDYRMVEGKWQPGQRDAFHSHPRMLYYWASDCSMRWYLPDGTTRDIDVKAGQNGTQEAIASHSVENRGTAECRVVMFEPREAD